MTTSGRQKIAGVVSIVRGGLIPGGNGQMRMTSAAVMSKTGAVLRLVRGLPVTERRVATTSTGRMREVTSREEICELFGLGGAANHSDKVATLKSRSVNEDETVVNAARRFGAK